MIQPKSLTQEAKVVKDILSTLPQREGVTQLCWLTCPKPLSVVGVKKKPSAQTKKSLAALLDPNFGKANVKTAGNE
jgi:hypothetical protein